MTPGSLIASGGALLLVASAAYALYDAVHVHFLRRAMVDGRTRMSLRPLWIGMAGVALIIVAGSFR